MNVVVDFGNSAAKVGIFDNEKFVARHTFPDAASVIGFLATVDRTHLIVSSVSADAQLIFDAAVVPGRKFILDQRLPVPVKNLYKTPHTLGVDRLAGVCGAQQRFPGKPCLVIDMGSCITYDFIDAQGAFRGGGISPGLNMRFRALNTFTARLPLISPAADVELIGDSTEASIRSGVVNGIAAELNGIIEEYRAKFSELRVILCGGDASLFENKLKASIFAGPEIVLEGLNSILIYNVSL